MDPQFVNGLQDLLQRLASATDTETIKAVTSSLNQQFYLNPICVPALLAIAKDHQQWQIRQLAAVEMRKRIPAFWGELSDETQQQIRDAVLQMILSETKDLTRHSLARVISSIAELDIPNQRWGELIQFLYQCCQSTTAAHREIGVYVLDSLFETIADTLSEHMQHLFDLFSGLINDPESMAVQVTTMEALGKIAEFIEPEERAAVQAFQGLVPAMVGVLQKCLEKEDEDSASRCFEVFSSMLLLETPLINRYFGELVEFSTKVAGNEDLEDNLRNLALNFLLCAATYKRGRLQKLKIVKPLIEKLMPITAQEGPEDMSEDAPSNVALGVINVLSTNLPPQQVFPTVFAHVVQYMQNPDPLYRKGAMLSLATVIEGCVDYVRTGTNEIIVIICAGLGDSDARVRSASCVALASVSDELSDEVGKHHEKLVPLIFNILNDSNMTIVKHAMTALDVIIEGMGDSVVRYLPDLMQRMVVVLETGADDLKPLALSVIGSVAHSSGQAFGPYFGEVIARIKNAMALTGDEDVMALRGVATDTAATVAEAAGKEAFAPHLEETMKLALQGMELESSNLRECGYCYFGVMSRVFGSDFAPFLSLIAPQLLQTLRIDESSAFGLETDEEPDMDDEDGQGQLGMSTAIADEKEVAIDAAAELFASTASGFLPYVEDIAKELVALLDHYSDSVRKSAVVTLFTFIRTFSKIGNAERWQAGVPLKVAIDDNTAAMIKLVMPALLQMWEDEDEKMVVAQICTELRSIMADVGPAVTIEYAEQISVRLLEIFEKKALCQTVDDDFDDEGGDDQDEDDLAEYDSMLICAAADCVAEFADVFGDAFAPIMDTFLPHIAGYAKPTFAVSERAMAVGCLAEITKNMGPAITKYAETLFPIFMTGLRDEHAEVASNGAYGVGVLIEAATIDATPYFGEVLKGLYPLVKRSDNTNNARDNAAGCVARLILENADAIPLADVVPAWIEALPIRGDHMEDLPVYDAVCYLLKNKRAEIEPFLPSLSPVLKQAMESPDTLFSDESRQYLASL